MPKAAEKLTQVRIDPDVRPMIKRAMKKKRSRSATAEVNSVLRDTYSPQPEIIRGRFFKANPSSKCQTIPAN